MKNEKNWPYQSAIALTQALANKEISSAELLETMISRIETLDKKINAVVVRDFEQARLSAKAADIAISKGQSLPLLGLPITVKESFNVAGLPTTWGNPQFKNWRPTEDALAVARLKAAGAIIIGKTNVPFMLMDYQSYNDLYGKTNNPWDISLTPGGSSGGAAAALAAGFTSLELGSDIGGSIRVPAHFCGVFGHKPSVNLIPMRGAGPPMTPPSPHLINDFLVSGPLARSADDLALSLKILAGPDEIWDGKGYQLALPPAKHNRWHDLRILIIKDHPLCTTSLAIHEAMDSLAENLSQFGAKISQDTTSVPDLKEITRTYVMLFAAFISGNMPIKEYRRLQERENQLSSQDTSPPTFFLRGCALTHRDWLMTERIRDLLRQQWRVLFKEYDVVICPVTPHLAFPHDFSKPAERKIEIDGAWFPYSDHYAWISIATLFGLPATVAPIALSKNGLPIGVQIIGDYLEDNTTLTIARLIERDLGGFSTPPNLF